MTNSETVPRSVYESLVEDCQSLTNSITILRKENNDLRAAIIGLETQVKDLKEILT